MTGQRTPEEIRRDIEETRHELGDTAAALAAKTDVKARAHEKVDDLRQTIGEKAGHIGEKAGSVTPESVGSAAGQAKGKARENPVPVAALAAFAGGFLLGRLTSRSDG